LTNRAGTFVVSRIPLRDLDGEVIGALGIVLADHPETTMQPLISKFAKLQKEFADAQRELAMQRRAKYTFASFIGTSPATQEVKRQCRRAAQSDSPVLLLGETGTGKELLAHAIHSASQRAERPLVGVNIAAVPENLLEAEFFGVAPGAYTGADRKGREGKFKLADGGTLFLDEIGDMPMALQVKLLRALQEQEIEALGSNRVVKVDVRVIAATSRDLNKRVQDGLFREDLFYRLNVLPIRVPALRERLTDLETLAEAINDSIARRSLMPPRELSHCAIDALAGHAWPGNVRELRNVLEQAFMLTDAPKVTGDDIRRVLQASAQGAGVIGKASGQPMPVGETSVALGRQTLPQMIAQLERQAIESALAATSGNKLAAAKVLGISRATLYEKLATYGLSPDGRKP
jgi:transcriptional regulator with PAS, ATPase and Fis domain